MTLFKLPNPSEVQTESKETPKENSNSINLDELYSNFNKYQYTGKTNRLGVVNKHKYYGEVEKSGYIYEAHFVYDITSDSVVDIYLPLSSQNSVEYFLKRL